MTTYENDVFVIPEKYKNMTVSELEKEKMKVLQKVNASERIRKTVKKNKKNIVFNF